MYKIFINNTEINVNSFSFEQDYQIFDLTTRDLRLGQRTKTVKVPDTKTNKQVFGFYNLISSDDKLSQKATVTGIIKYGNTIIFEGVVKVTGWDNSGISFVIYSNNSTWLEQFTGEKLQDIDYSDYDHTYSAAVQLASETSPTGYVYPIIDYGGIKSNEDYQSGGVSTGYRRIDIEDRYPAVQISTLFQKMFNEKGITLEGDILTHNAFTKLYFPYNKRLLQNASDFPDDKVFRATSAAHNKTSVVPSRNVAYRVPFTTIDFDTGSNFEVSPSTQTRYVIPESGYYNFKTTVEFTATKVDSGSLNAMGDLYIKAKLTNGNFITLARSDHNIDLTDNDAVTFTLSVETGSILVDVAYTEYIYVYAKLSWSYDIAFAGRLRLNTAADGEFYNQVSLQMARGNTMTWANDNLPDISKLDFIQGLKEIFNLFFDYNDNTRTLRIDTFDNYFTDISTYNDWSSKVDISKMISINEIIPPKKDIYSYQTDDIYTENNEEINNKKFIEHSKEFQNTFKDNEVNVENSIFATTMMLETLSGINIKVPTVRKKDDNSRDTKITPRILYYDGVISLTDSGAWYSNGSAEANKRTSIPLLRSYNDVTLDSFNMMYGDIVTGRGLYNKYHKQTANIRDESYIVELYVYLKTTDILNLSFRKKIYIDNHKIGKGFYYLNKIDSYSPANNGSTKIELIKVVDSEYLEEIQQPENVDIYNSATNLATGLQRRPTLSEYIDNDGNTLIGIDLGSRNYLTIDQSGGVTTRGDALYIEVEVEMTNGDTITLLEPAQADINGRTVNLTIE